MSPGRKRLVTAAVVGCAGIAALQVLPVQRIGIHTEVVGTNPPQRFEIDAPPEILAILRRACFDCHSNETRWPIYARIAPISWFVVRHVHTGRNHLNFSQWGDADAEERQIDKEDCWDQIAAGNMPLWSYVYPIHLRARLSSADKSALKGWLLQKSTKPGAATTSAP